MRNKLMKSLPNEIWNIILDFLSYHDLLNTKKTSKFFRSHVTEELLSQKLYEHETASIDINELIFY